MLHAIEINSSNADNKELKQLYETAFPAEEQIPYDELIQLLDAMNIDYTAYMKGKCSWGLQWCCACHATTGVGISLCVTSYAVMAMGNRFCRQCLTSTVKNVLLSWTSSRLCRLMRPTPNNARDAMHSTCATA